MNDSKSREAKQRIAAMAGLLVDGSEQNYSYGALLGCVFRNRANEAICGSRIAGLLADILDEQAALAQTQDGDEQNMGQQSGVTGTSAIAQLTNGDVRIVPAPAKPAPTQQKQEGDALARECADRLESYLDDGDFHVEDIADDRRLIAEIRGEDFRHPIQKFWDDKTKPTPPRAEVVEMVARALYEADPRADDNGYWMPWGTYKHADDREGERLTEAANAALDTLAAAGLLACWWG